MGASLSNLARSAAEDTRLELLRMMTILENKRDEFLLRLIPLRGPNVKNTEVSGGRTIMRSSEIRASTGSGPDQDLSGALGDFFEAAQGGKKAKSAAVEGSKKVLMSGLNALFGATEGQGLEKQGFTVLFMNNAFVRVDFFVYAYTAKGKAWGAQDSISGACYVADMSVLDTSSLAAEEIDFLLSQALVSAPSKDDGGASAASGLDVINKMKIMLAESAVLSQMLQQPNIDFKKVKEIATELADTQKSIKQAFDNLPDFKPASAAAPATK